MMAGFISKAVEAANHTMEKQAQDKVPPMPQLNIEVEDEVLLIPHQLIHADPDQPRKERDPVEFLKVKNSIKQTKGNTQPVEVRKHPTIKGAFMLVFGQGRWEACKEHDFRVRAILKSNYDDEQKESNPNVAFDRKFAQVSENVGRNDLAMVRQAEGLLELVSLHIDNLSDKEVGEMLGYNKSQTSRLMKLAKAPAEIKQLSIDGISQNINFLMLMMDLHSLVDAKVFQQHLDDAKDKKLFERGLREIVKGIKESKKHVTSPTESKTEPEGEDQLNLSGTEQPLPEFPLIQKAVEDKGCPKKSVKKILENITQAQEDGYSINENEIAEHINALSTESAKKLTKYDSLVDDCLALYEKPADIRPPAAPEDISLFPEMESCEIVDGFLLIYIKGYKLPLKVNKNEAKSVLGTAIEQM